jgi:IS5 family transposase
MTARHAGPGIGGASRLHGYKAPVVTDQEAGLIRGVDVTAANAHDVSELGAVLPDAPGDTYGDSAYQGNRTEGIIRAMGGRPRIVYTGGFGGDAAAARLRVYNADVRRVRCRHEKMFGTIKGSYGLRRMRWVGFTKAGLQVRLAAVAYNLRRSLALLAANAA